MIPLHILDSLYVPEFIYCKSGKQSQEVAIVIDDVTIL